MELVLGAESGTDSTETRVKSYLYNIRGSILLSMKDGLIGSRKSRLIENMTGVFTGI